MPAAMAQKNDEEYKKDQDVEIYDSSKDRWIGGKIYDIRQSEDKNIYCVEYEEYSMEIHGEDVHSTMRTVKTDKQSNDQVAKDILVNFRKEIPTRLPVSHQTQVLLDGIRNTATQRMLYLYIQCE